MSAYSIFHLGDQAVSFEFTGRQIDPFVHHRLVSMKRWLEANAFPGMRDVVLGYRSLSILFDLVHLPSENKTATEFLSDTLEKAYLQSQQTEEEQVGSHVKIPVCYSAKFGLDSDLLCEHNSITRDELIQLHCSVSYKVYLIGFQPGFPYLGFVDHRIESPRHPSPRSIVPAGSVGIAGKQTGIYPFASPGGWKIIGRTPVKLFDQKKHPPVLLEAGDTVSFFPITEEEFDHLASTHD